MRKIPVLIFLALVVSPAIATGQSLELFGSAGPTITDTGHSLAAGIGFSPASRLGILVNFERTHLSSRTTRDRDAVSRFRGGTLFVGSAEMRFLPFGRSRVGPYGLAGFAAGVSRPNVNDAFPERVTHDVRAFFAGGGIHVPVGERLTVFGDVRMMIGAEGIEGIVAVAPVRAGVSWRLGN